MTPARRADRQTQKIRLTADLSYLYPTRLNGQGGYRYDIAVARICFAVSLSIQIADEARGRDLEITPAYAGNT
jgi:hypothetical protein